MPKTISMKQADELVMRRDRFVQMSETIKEYSYKKDDGKRFNVRQVGNSRHYSATSLYDHLSHADKEAINRYIVGKLRKTIKNDKEILESVGVNTKELLDE